MIRILSTDFDGTVINHSQLPHVSEAFLRELELCRQAGAVWAINTGRALHHIVEGILQFDLPQPDYVLTSEREVFRPDGKGGWIDFGDWNIRCTKAHDELYAVARPVFEKVREYVENRPGTRFLDDDTGIGIVAASEPELDRILQHVDELRAHIPALHYQRNTVYVRFCHSDYSKGAALAELGRLLQINRGEIFAAGDHLNDLPMLDGEHAAMVACPANSAEVVKTLVRKSGGFVSRKECGDGVAEGLRHFRMKNIK